MKLGGDKRQYVLTVGDDGAIMILVDGKRLIKRIFCSSPAAPEFLDMLKEAPNAPISLLVDVVDQSYSLQTLPPVNKMNVSKLVARKLEKDFDASDLKAAIPLGREKSGRKEWTFLFVSVRNVSPLSDWIETVSNATNPFKGIFLLPVEAMNYLKDIHKVTEADRKSKDSEWKIIVSHNRVGGFRQIVFRNGNVIFTRIAQPVGSPSPDVTAGNVEQETLNTVEYIRRLGFMDSQGLDIYIIAAVEVKAAIQRSSLPSSSRIVLTPFEIAQKLGLDQAAEERDRFGDVVAAVHFTTMKKPILKMTTAYNQQVEKLDKLRFSIRVGAVALILAFIGLSINDFLTVQGVHEQLEASETSKNNNMKLLTAFEGFKSKFQGEGDRMRELTDLSEILGKNRYFFFDVMKHYKDLARYDASVSDLSLTVLAKEEEPSVAEATFTIDFPNRNNQSLDKLLDDVDHFTADARKAYPQFKVSFEGLPSGNQTRVDLAGASAQAMSIKMKVNGPLVEKAPGASAAAAPPSKYKKKPKTK